jgi:hypothetical protein
VPADYSFQPSDAGTHMFAGGVTLYTAGTWDITATDATGNLTDSTDVAVIPAPAVAFQVIAPAIVVSGTPFDITVEAVDSFGNIDTNYAGIVAFSTTDPDAGVVLPLNYTFQPSDAGRATFPNGVTLITPGDETVTVTDTIRSITGSVTVTVAGGNAPSRRGADRRSGPALDTASPERIALDWLFGTGEEERPSAWEQWQPIRNALGA